LNLLDTQLDNLILHVDEAFAPVQQLKAAEPDHLELQRVTEPLLAAAEGGSRRRPFHWLVEFPEVFLGSDNAGFDAILSNPPFIGGKKISGLFGDDYRNY
jgi:hypothetical protein